MKKLTQKQQEILTFIKSFSEENGYAPSVREIGADVGLNSPSTVHMHLTNLQKSGYLKKSDKTTRSIILRGVSSTVRNIPLLENVTAGTPVFAQEGIEEYIPFDCLGDSYEYFALKIKDDSMIGAGILVGDKVIVRKQSEAQNDQIVVALVGDESTCKRFTVKDSKTYLISENRNYPPINGQDASILGIVKGLTRNF